jgi:hypothetical protein
LEVDAESEQIVLFHFPTNAEHEYIRSVVLIETGGNADNWPTVQRQIRPYVFDDIPQAFNEPAYSSTFDMRTISKATYKREGARRFRVSLPKTNAQTQEQPLNDSAVNLEPKIRNRRPTPPVTAKPLWQAEYGRPQAHDRYALSNAGKMARRCPMHFGTPVATSHPLRRAIPRRG